MRKSEVSVADVINLHLLKNCDVLNQMRTYIFCMDIENVSKELDIELPETKFIEEFMIEISKSIGYLSFSSFCKISIDELRDLGHEAYSLLK